MATLMKTLSYFASFILCLLLAGCGADSDVVVVQESAPTFDVLEPVSYTHLTLPTTVIV